MYNRVHINCKLNNKIVSKIILESYSNSLSDIIKLSI